MSEVMKIYEVFCVLPSFLLEALVESICFFMFAPCINSIKALFVIPTDAHNYKITAMLKQLKFRQLL